jgi:N-ethylmaleimide reductase
VHAGNGYLLDQFLRDGANQRDDEYGGTARNRTRLLREVTAAIISVWGRSRVGVRISPLSPTNGMADSDPGATFTRAAHDLQQLGGAYLHVIEPGVNGTLSGPAQAEVAPAGQRILPAHVLRSDHRRRRPHRENRDRTNPAAAS